MSDGLLIRSARKFADLRVRGLARLCGLTGGSISLVEAGELKFSDATRQRVLRVLLVELARTQDIPLPPCSNERDVRQALGRLLAAAEVLRAERALLSANSLLALWG
jgi:transcriptional regulator with XRE-family HTH domain